MRGVAYVFASTSLSLRNLSHRACRRASGCSSQRTYKTSAPATSSRDARHLFAFFTALLAKSSLTRLVRLQTHSPVGVLLTGHHAVRCVHTFPLSTLLSRRRETWRPLQLLSFESVCKLCVP